MSRKRVVQFVGVLLTVIGLAGIPQDLRNWAEAFEALGHDVSRWIFVGVGLLLIAIASRSRPNPGAKGNEGLTHEDVAPDGLSMFALPDLERRFPTGAEDVRGELLGRLPAAQRLRQEVVMDLAQFETWRDRAGGWTHAFDSYVRNHIPPSDQNRLLDVASRQGKLLVRPYNEEHKGWLGNLANYADNIRRYTDIREPPN